MSTWTLTIDQCGRPLLANATHKMHPRAATAARAVWRDTTATLARAARIPTLEGITVEARCRYPDRRSLPDTDAASPAVKGCIDGLVAAGVLTNDTPEFVRRVAYLAPVVARGLPPALILTIEETM